MDRRGVKTKVTLFLVVGVFLTALLLILFTKTTTLFYPSYEIKMRTAHVGELRPGNGVFLSGVKIGDVVGIELEPDLKHAIVRMKIVGQYRIGKDARFAIHQQGVLGQYYVEVIATGVSREYLKEGDLVQCEDTIDFIEAGRLSYGLITRVKETMKRIEGVFEKSRNIFNSNTFSEVDLIANNFGKAVEKGTSTVFIVSSLIETNSPVLKKFSSNFEMAGKNWGSLTSSFSVFTNQIMTVYEKVEPYLDNIGTNISTINREASQFRSATPAGATNFTEKISRLLNATRQINEFAKNLNTIGLAGAIKENTKKHKESKVE